jgi:AraC-like DNA-binding protein
VERTFREFEPHPALRPFVDRYWARSGAAVGDSGPSRILPDGCIDLVVHFAHGSSAVVVGTMTRATLFESAQPGRIVGVRFRPGGAWPFLGVAAYELTDLVVDSHALRRPWLTHWTATPAPRLVDAVRTLERTLLERLPAIETPNPLVARAVSALFAPEPPSIAALASELGCSRQHLRREVRFHVGVSPVQLARVARMQHAVAQLQRSDEVGLAETALRLGYFDQSHMTRDLRELAGVTPGEVVAAPASILPVRSLLGDR